LVTVPQDWWRSFFSGVALDLWRQAIPEQHTRADADFLYKTFRASPGARLLDVPRGNGRVALELAARGCPVTGVDIAQSYIDEAHARSAERNLPATWKHGEMRDLPWTAQFDGAYCWGNSFGYLEDEGNAVFLQSVAGALKPGGRFVLETGTALESLLPNYQERRWYEIGDILFCIANHYDPLRSRLDTEYTFVRDGKVDKRLGSQRAYSCNELCRLAAEAGFADVACYGSTAGEPYEPYRLGSPHLILAATKC